MFPVYSLRCRFISISTVNSLSSNHFVHFKTLIDRYISNCNLSDRMNVISMFIWEFYRKSDFYRIEFQENIFNSDLWIVQYIQWKLFSSKSKEYSLIQLQIFKNDSSAVEMICSNLFLVCIRLQCKLYTVILNFTHRLFKVELQTPNDIGFWKQLIRILNNTVKSIKFEYNYWANESHLRNARLEKLGNVFNLHEIFG